MREEREKERQEKENTIKQMREDFESLLRERERSSQLIIKQLQVQCKQIERLALNSVTMNNQHVWGSCCGGVAQQQNGAQYNRRQNSFSKRKRAIMAAGTLGSTSIRYSGQSASQCRPSSPEIDSSQFETNPNARAVGHTGGEGTPAIHVASEKRLNDFNSPSLSSLSPNSGPQTNYNSNNLRASSTSMISRNSNTPFAHKLPQYSVKRMADIASIKRKHECFV